MASRQQERLPLRLTATIWGLKPDGTVFVERARTVDISPAGARVTGLEYVPEPGTVVGIQHGGATGRFRVVWVKNGTSQQHEMGLSCLEVGQILPKIILYVDDSESDIERRRAVLQAGGFFVLTASDVDSAHYMLQEKAVDCVILDHPLPGVSVEREVAYLREQFPEVRILLTSAYPGTVPEQALQKSDGFVHKGAPASDLLTTLSQLVGSPSQLNWPLARLAPRYPVITPVSVSVFRSGEPFSSKGESTDLGETGIGVVLHADFSRGEFVSVRFTVPTSSEELIIRAVVRHRSGDHYGFEFIGPNSQQIEAIRSLCSVLVPINTPHP